MANKEKNHSSEATVETSTTKKEEKIVLKEEYASENEIKVDLAIFNEGKSEEEKTYYCSYLNSLTNKRMYVPCTREYFFKWRNMMAEEHRKRDLDSRCLIESKRYGLKICMEDCKHCPYGKAHRERYVSLEALGEISDSSQLDKHLKEELMDEIWKLVDEFDEESQQILHLFNDGFTDLEIAKRLGLKKNTVQYKRNRLIEIIKGKLKN